MKNKTFELIKLLSAKELKGLRQHLASQKRKSLPILLSVLQKQARTNTKTDKAAVYTRLFGEPYTKGKDYLLRNEFRLLNQELVEFIVAEKIRKKVNGDATFRQSLFAEWLLEKPDAALAEEALYITNETKKQQDLAIAAGLQKLFISHYISHKEATEKNYCQLLKYMDEFYEMAGTDYLHRVMEVKMKQAFAERTLKQLNPKSTLSTGNLPDLLTLAQKDTYLLFTIEVIKSYGLSGQKKIEVLKKALALCKQVTKKDFERTATQASLCALIALEYYLGEQYDKAMMYHRMALAEQKGIASEHIISYVFNYISTLIKMENYKAAILQIESYRNKWSNMARVRDRFLCLKAMCHLFLGQPEEANQCIPHNRKRSGLDHYYYYRFIQILVYLLRTDYSLAITETETFIHTVRNNDKNNAYLKLSLLLLKYLRLLLIQNFVAKNNYLKKLSRLLKSVEKSQKQLQIADHGLLYKWLYQKVIFAVKN